MSSRPPQAPATPTATITLHKTKQLVCCRYWAGYHLSTTIATPAAYAPLPFAFAALTWPGGIITLMAGIIVTLYCSYILVSPPLSRLLLMLAYETLAWVDEQCNYDLQAGLNEWNGVRYYRYRDLTASIYGRPGYIATIIMQQIASIGNNVSKSQLLLCDFNLSRFERPTLRSRIPSLCLPLQASRLWRAFLPRCVTHLLCTGKETSSIMLASTKLNSRCPAGHRAGVRPGQQPDPAGVHHLLWPAGAHPVPAAGHPYPAFRQLHRHRLHYHLHRHRHGPQHLQR